MRKASWGEASGQSQTRFTKAATRARGRDRDSDPIQRRPFGSYQGQESSRSILRAAMCTSRAFRFNQNRVNKLYPR